MGCSFCLVAVYVFEGVSRGRSALCGWLQPIKRFESCLLIDPESPIIGWNLIEFRRVVVRRKLLHIVWKKPLDFVARTVMNHIHKARFAQFDEHFEMVSRFAALPLSDWHLFGEIAFGHQGLKGPQ